MTPPDSGDAKNTSDDDPLGGMDPMAWLESLARRQGANPDELTTAANLDIATPSADTAINGPGYTPGYDTGKSQPAKAAPQPSKPVIPASQTIPVPPPVAQPVAAADDPFNGMDMMAWMESLARRQGANPDELTTAANLDIAMPSADTAVNGPGYTPGYDTGKSQPVKAVSESKPQAKQQAPDNAQITPPAQIPATPVAEPVASTVTADDPLGGMDPMAWLESLARRQGANPDELTTAANLNVPTPSADTAITGPGYTPGYETSKTMPIKPIAGTKIPAPTTSVALPPITPPEPETVAPVASTTPAASDDPLGGMDPMAFMESLARRQGVNPNELTTAANLDIATPPPGTVIDEPGYVEYDPFSVSSTQRASESSKAPVPPAAETPIAEPVASSAGDDLLGEMDPLAWLESLSLPQSAELTESLTRPISDVPPVSGEPEYVEPAEAAMSADEAAQVLGMGAVGAAQPSADAMASMDPMAWLESLSLGQDTAEFTTFDFSQAPDQTAEDYSMIQAAGTPGDAMAPESTLSWLEALAQGQDESALPVDDTTLEPNFEEQLTTAGVEQSSEVAMEMTPLEAGGLSNDINEVQRWLDEQAQSLELTRVALEDEDSNELALAEPGQLPDWLVTSMADTGLSAPVLSSEIIPPATPSDLPPWLAENEVESADLAFDADFFQLNPAISEESVVEAAPVGLTVDELAALTKPTSPEEIDSWAEALDEEYERRQAGDESVPNWYLDALARVETAPNTREVPEPVAAISDISQPVGEVPSYDDFELPDWLRETPEEAAPAIQGELPDWLLSMSREGQAIPLSSVPDQTVAEPIAEPAESTVVAGDDMDWLDAANLTPSVIPDWLKSAAPPEPVIAEPVQAPEPIEAAKPVEVAAPIQEPVSVTPVVVPIVETPIVAEPVRVETKPVRQLAQVPAIDHQARLQQARQLVASAQVPDSLEHYQTLIDSSQLLEETRGDLRQLVDQNPKEPKLRRLLGDTHMRLGDLQAALDTYRSALDQL